MSATSSRSGVQLVLARHSDWSLRQGQGHVLSWVGGWVGWVGWVGGWGGWVGDITCIFFAPMSTIDDSWLSFVPPPVARGRCARIIARDFRVLCLTFADNIASLISCFVVTVLLCELSSTLSTPIWSLTIIACSIGLTC